MEEQFVPYELALKLKKLGFNKECFAVYLNGTFFGSPSIFNKNGSREGHLYDCTAPLWQQAFDFFREKYKLHSRVFFDGLKEINDDDDEERYDFDIVEQWEYNKSKDYYDYRYGFKHVYSSRGIFSSYTEARLGCLEKLIELTESLCQKPGRIN